MKIFNPIFLFVLSLSASAGLSQEVALYRPAQMHADIEKFKTTLINIHPGTYTHQSPEEFEQLVDDLKLKTSEPMPPLTFYKIVLKLIAGIHDGHTQAYAFGNLGGVLYSQKRLPFQVYIHDERIFIVKNLSSQKIPEGSELIAIDGRLSNEILDEILKHYSSDGMSKNGILHWLGSPYRPFYRIYPEIFEEQSSYSVVYRDYETKEIVSTSIRAISAESYEKEDSTRYSSKKKP